jgi:hypothetical protein
VHAFFLIGSIANGCACRVLGDRRATRALGQRRHTRFEY